MFKRKSECHKLQGLLSPYIDGQLGPSDRERLESHLEGCQACRRELESLGATVKLLHRVAMVSPPRSFVLAEEAPKRSPAAALTKAAPKMRHEPAFGMMRAASVAATWRPAFSLGVLRVATAVAAMLLLFVLAGDATHLFEAGPVEERTAQQVTPMANEDIGAGGLSSDGEGYTWPVRELELALSGVVVALGGATALLWQRRRRGEKALKG